MAQSFWQTLQDILLYEHIIIDRPAGQPHPRFPSLIYPLDYGFLEHTTSADGEGIDVWLGSLNTRKLTGILCTFDIFKRDAEIKLLSGCSNQDVKVILDFNNDMLRYHYIPNPEANE